MRNPVWLAYYSVATMLVTLQLHRQHLQQQLQSTAIRSYYWSNSYYSYCRNSYRKYSLASGLVVSAQVLPGT
jgi:hypothetical protein